MKLYDQNNTQYQNTDMMKWMEANVLIMKLIQQVQTKKTCKEKLTEDEYNEIEEKVNAIWGKGKSVSGIGEGG